MKMISKLAAVLSLASLLSPLALSAKTKSMEQTYVESYQGRAGIPVPISVVAPPSQNGTTGVVEIAFVVNESGKPTQIAVQSATDDSLVAPVKKAIAQWTFNPATLNGAPIAKKVVLPVRFVTASAE